MHCAPTLLIVETNLSATFDCWSVSIWLWLFLAGLSSRNYWEPQYLTHLQVGGKFFSTVTLLYYLCFAPNVLTAGVVLCWRVTWTFCLQLHFRGCWLLFFVVVHFYGSLWSGFISAWIFMNRFTGPPQCAHQMIKCMMHGIKWIEQSCLTVVIILVILLPLVTFKQGTLEQKENGC